MAAALAAWMWADVLLLRAPGWPEALGWAGLLAALAVAAAVPAARGFCSVVIRGERDDAMALTFDDGPDPRTTPGVLDALHRHGARATFFVIGHKAAAHPELVRRMIDEGHEVGLHGWSHDWREILTPRRARASLDRARRAVMSAGGATPTLYRPPYGVITPAVARAAAELGLEVVGWTRRGLDTARGADPEACLRRLVTRALPGDILLLHDAPQTDRSPQPLGPQLVQPVLATLRSRGLRALLVGELLGGQGFGAAARLR